MARKLVKEMEAHKVSRGSRVSVRNRYTIFLCEDDFDRLSPARDNLIGKLERHLGKHVRSKRYDLVGDVCVDICLDTDLRLGHFGILAEREAPGFVEQELPGRYAEDVVDEDEWRMAAVASPAVGRGAARDSFAPAPGTRANGRVTEQTEGPAAMRAGTGPGVNPATAPARVVTSRPADLGNGGATRVIAPSDAAQLGLAHNIIIIRSGNRVREYTQGRVIVGRAKDVDFRIDNPDVSRRHAAIYWSDGQVMLDDLASTNGTMVNGYPISSTTITPDDVVVIGDCRMSVDCR